MVCLQVGPDLVSTAVIKIAAQEKNCEDQIRKPTDGREWWQAITMAPKNLSKQEMDRVMQLIKGMFSPESQTVLSNKERGKKPLSMEEYKRKRATQPDGVETTS